MDLFLVSHDILGIISKARMIITKDNDIEVHKPLGYQQYSIKQLQEILPQYDIKELKFAIDVLFFGQSNFNNCIVIVIMSSQFLDYLKENLFLFLFKIHSFSKLQIKSSNQTMAISSFLERQQQTSLAHQMKPLL